MRKMTRVYTSNPSIVDPIELLASDVERSYGRDMRVEVHGKGCDAVARHLASISIPADVVAKDATGPLDVWVGGNRFGVAVHHVPWVPGTVTIGAQVWANQNVSAVTYKDGGEITRASDLDTFARLGPAWTYIEGGEGGGGTPRQVLYNAHVDFSRLCPAGYRVPTKADWVALRTYYRENPLTPGATVATSLADGPFGARLTGFIDRNTDDPMSTMYLYAEGFSASWWIDKQGSFYIERRPAVDFVDVAKYYNDPVQETMYYGLSLRLIRI